MKSDRILRALRNTQRIGEVFSCMLASPQWPTLVPTFVLKWPLKFPYEFRTRLGQSIELDSWDDLTSVWHVFFGTEYFVPRDSKTIVDLGANIGSFSVWAASRCPNARIHCLEPFPETYRRLVETLERNTLTNRVLPLELAVAGHNGPGNFDATPGKRSYCRQIVPAHTDIDALSVECISLESLLDRLELAEVDCLKIDVEGGEYAIFAESSIDTLRRARIITMEFHDGERSRVLWDKLDAANFECVGRQDGGWSGLASYRRLDRNKGTVGAR